MINKLNQLISYDIYNCFNTGKLKMILTLRLSIRSLISNILNIDKPFFMLLNEH